MHVLITRPEHDAAELKSRLEGLGCRVTVAPLLEIELGHIAVELLAGAGGLIATSRNGLRALAKSPAFAPARSLPMFVVGPATEALARELGFTLVSAGPGTAAELVPLICEHPASRQGGLVHLAGDHVAFDLTAALNARGVRLTSIPAYRSIAAKTLIDPVPALIAKQALDAVILMSPRSARVWAELTHALPGNPDLAKVTSICLSDAVALELGSRNPARTEIALQANADEIVALVYRLADRAKTG